MAPEVQYKKEKCQKDISDGKTELAFVSYSTLVQSLHWIVKLMQPSIHRFEFQLYEQLTNFKATAFHKIEFLSTHFGEHIKITFKHGWLLFQKPRNDWCSTTYS